MKCSKSIRQVNTYAKLGSFTIPLDIIQVKFVVLNFMILPQTSISRKYHTHTLAFHPQPRSPRFQRLTNMSSEPRSGREAQILRKITCN